MSDRRMSEQLYFKQQKTPRFPLATRLRCSYMGLGPSSGHAGGNDAACRHGSAHWRLAVGGLRLSGLGLFAAVGGLVTRVWSAGIGLTILAVGVGVYLVGVVVVYTGFIPAIRELPKPRPSFWRLRRLLVRDALRSWSRDR